MAWAFPGASGDAHGDEGCREGYVGSRKPLQEGAAHCGGGAIAGRGSTRVSVNAKIQFEKQVPLSAEKQGCVKDITKPVLWLCCRERRIRNINELLSVSANVTRLEGCPTDSINS